MTGMATDESGTGSRNVRVKLAFQLAVHVPFWALVLLATAGFGAVGFADDYLKIVRRSHHGLLPRYKMLWLTVIALAVGVALVLLANQPTPLFNTRLIFPFFKTWIP